jgi:hypothetical protein
MSRTLSTKSQGEVVKQITRPVFLVEFGFGSPLRLSTRETIIVSGGNTFTAAGIRVNLNGLSIDLFNETFQHTASFMAGVGSTLKVWQVYGPQPFASADLDQVFDGLIGSVTIGTTLRIAMREVPPLYTPRVMVQPPLCTHLPPDGVLWITPTGTYRITSD